MKIIISPAKKMLVDTDSLPWQDLPALLEKTEELRIRIAGLSYVEAKALWACNDQIAEENYRRYQAMELRKNLTPAILAFDGIQYTYMAPSVFEQGQFDYVQENLRILSGFYGVLKPMDGVTPYRLEMQAKLRNAGYKNLYDFWGDALYREVMDESVLWSIWLQRSIPGVWKSICSRETALSPAYLAYGRMTGLSRRASTRRWQEEKWYGSWQIFISFC